MGEKWQINHSTPLSMNSDYKLLTVVIVCKWWVTLCAWQWRTHCDVWKATAVEWFNWLRCNLKILKMFIKYLKINLWNHTRRVMFYSCLVITEESDAWAGESTGAARLHLKLDSRIHPDRDPDSPLLLFQAFLPTPVMVERNSERSKESRPLFMDRHHSKRPPILWTTKRLTSFWQSNASLG